MTKPKQSKREMVKDRLSEQKKEPATSITYPPEYVRNTSEETMCGARDDSQHVEQYDGTLGVTKEFVNTHQPAVGQIQWNDDLDKKYTDPGNVKDIRWCSGMMISDDLFLSAGHCFDSNPDDWIVPRKEGTNEPISPPEIAKNMHVNFNHQHDTTGKLRSSRSFPILELLEYRRGELDYAIVKLDGKPGNIYGFKDISSEDAVVGDMLCIIGHPEGDPKKIEAGPATDFRDNRIGYKDIDTFGGTSGAGILISPKGIIVGVHTNGGCGRAIGHNYGHRITSLIQISPIIAKLVKK
jgi:V8-like Glu-specific endopeptidase